jgi:hypothetical protein
MSGLGPFSLPSTTSAGLTITYTVVSGPGQISGHTLRLTGSGIVRLVATQAGNSSFAPLTETETFLTTLAAADTPTLPLWGMILLAVLLLTQGARRIRTLHFHREAATF